MSAPFKAHERGPTDLAKRKLEKLMDNIDKPVSIPERRDERKFPDAPEFVRNIMGSSAGAGSGEFHVYRHLRRKEYARQRFIREQGRKEEADREFEERVEAKRKKAEERTAKKRAKRLKKKNKSQKQTAEQQADGTSDPEDDSGEDDKADGQDEVQAETAPPANTCSSVPIEGK